MQRGVARDPLEPFDVTAERWLDQLLDELQGGTGDENGGGHPPVDRSGRRDLQSGRDVRRYSEVVMGLSSPSR